MGWYKAGKVNVVAGQTSVAGVGTDFAANSLVGEPNPKSGMWRNQRIGQLGRVSLKPN